MEIVPPDEIELEFLRASGPGGQNVNKVETAVRLRFNARRSRALAEDERERLIRIAGRRATREGVVVLLGRRCRTQEKNREDVLARLEALIERARRAPRLRRRTRPTAAAKKRRREAKERRAQTKRARRPVAERD